MSIELDRIDLRILAALQNNGRLQNIDLANKVGLSASPCLRRVKNLENNGVIEAYTALLNPKMVGYPLTVFARVSLTNQSKASVDGFEKAIQQRSEILDCYLITGEYDYLLRIVAQSLESYHEFLQKHLTQIPNVQNFITEIPLKQVKATQALPIKVDSRG